MGKLWDIWKKNNNGEISEEKSFFRYAIISSAVFVVLVGFVNHDNVIRWIRAGFEVRHQNKQIELYRQDIQEMEETIDGLKGNLDSLERFAREKFKFAEPGEDVYLDNK